VRWLSGHLIVVVVCCVGPHSRGSVAVGTDGELLIGCRRIPLSLFLNHKVIFKLRFLARLQFFRRFSRSGSYTARYVHCSEVGSGGGGGAWLLGDGAIAAILTEI